MRHGFTLIELLVVITIIVVLLALLMPALDRAVYQAQLAVCASKLDAVAMGATTYATQYRRSYPNRVGAAWPMQVCNGASLDDRPLFRQFLSINKTLRCPLSGDWDMENTARDAANRLELTYSSYLMWFGFKYTTVPARSMKRLGDRLEYGGDQFSILAHDTDVPYTATVRSFTAHQDDRQAAREWSLRHEPYPDAQTFIASAGHSYSFWWWQTPDGVERGLIDNNYAYDDGSVRRINGLKFIRGDDTATAADAGMAMLPIHPATGAHEGWKIEVPTR